MLLMIYVVSIVAPIFILQLMIHNHGENPEAASIEIGELTGGITEATGKTVLGLTSGKIIAMIYYIYIIGTVITATYFLIGLGMLERIIRRGKKTEYDTFTLIIVENTCHTSPFSRGKSIVMTERDYEESGDLILLHEHAHLRHQHWIDIMIASATICIQWYNPLAWALREELKAVHEYQADETVMNTGADVKEYQMLLLKKAVGYGYQSLANNLNHSKLQNRVTMMYKEKTSLRRRLFALAMIPAIGAGIAVTSIPSVAGVLESIAESSITNSSSTPEVSLSPKDREVYTAVENQADFPGGMEALMEFLSNNIRYPESAMKADIQGRVIIQFVIESDGTVTDAKIVRGVSPELDEEALRVVSIMPKWIPGKVNGKAVASQFTIPVNFRLSAPTPEKENK